jgi:hypothetical protein
MDTEPGYERLMGADAYDSDGDKIGDIRNIFYDDITHRPEWVAVNTGLFGSKQTFAPLAGASVMTGGDEEGERVRLAVTKAQVKDAPRYDEEVHLSAIEEQELYRHYGFDWNQSAEAGHYGYGDAGRRERFDRDFPSGWRDEWMSETHGRDDSRERDERDDVVAEETVTDQKAVVREEPKRVRLRKHQWTEQVPVQREEVRIEEDARSQTARHA